MTDMVQWSVTNDPESWAAPDLWMPIETAPKDVWIFVYLPNEGKRGTMHSARHAKIANGYMWMIGHTFGFDLSKPTHWMPLPGPPEQPL